MRLFPRIKHAMAAELVNCWKNENLEYLVSQSRIRDPRAFYAPVGGNKVSDDELGHLQKKIRQLALSCGYPNKLNNKRIRKFDGNCAALLHKEMNISPHEASKDEIWIFLTCILLPEIPRWRFPGERKNNFNTKPERYLGGRRNLFQRLWWRAEILMDASNDQPYKLLALLNEDELVQIIERPLMAGNKKLAQRTSWYFLKIVEERKPKNRRELLREAQKILMRFSAFVSFSALSYKQLDDILCGVFQQALRSYMPEKQTDDYLEH